MDKSRRYNDDTNNSSTSGAGKSSSSMPSWLRPRSKGSFEQAVHEHYEAEKQRVVPPQSYRSLGLTRYVQNLTSVETISQNTHDAQNTHGQLQEGIQPQPTLKHTDSQRISDNSENQNRSNAIKYLTQKYLQREIRKIETTLKNVHSDTAARYRTMRDQLQTLKDCESCGFQEGFGTIAANTVKEMEDSYSESKRQGNRTVTGRYERIGQTMRYSFDKRAPLPEQ